jgi:lipopolysaccharide transport system ATP-binding protein
MTTIELDNVCLDYIIKTGSDSIGKTAVYLAGRLLNVTANRPRKLINHSTYRALKNINLSLTIGDRVGLLGQNGAGKSTLLKVLAKIYRPNSGSIHIKGKIASVFDASLGINHDATGYENIINLGMMKGFSKKQTEQIIPDVENFTELGDFLQKPVSTFSTGMQMKLVFAVATAFYPEIMLIDEIIGVGDHHFIERAMSRLDNAIERSHILVLTSHSNDIIKRFCNKVIVMHQGEIQFMGDVEPGIEFYTRTT